MNDESLFTAALAISDPVARAAFLENACAGNPDQRRRIEELLSASDQSNPLDRPPVDLAQTGAHFPATAEAGPSAVVGDRIGPYKLLERIGEGGMGEVWVADQLEPIKRRVALKLIKPGMDSRSVLARFEAERQALAVMDHPNIAKVLDAGQTADGRPYFVMELVKGTPITEFADARRLTPQQRLELFVPVCQAIQHAHMKGIIHRDIKPSNVLVALHDETPVPKVIDFGVAKAVGQQLTDKTLYTAFGALVGTPAYMAPEQATFNQLDVDTRADVYALGVLLYELLAGSPPIEKERLKKAALDEVLRIVREEEPPRPSQRLSTTETRASIAAVRGTDPAKLSALMKGELDWIVMKALEKDRSRRYETANGFAADVQRYLAGEPVQAVPPSLGYQLYKAYQRNKMAVWVAVAFTLLIFKSAAASLGLAYIARQAERRALEERNTAEAERANAETARKVAERNAIKLQIAADMLEYDRFPFRGLLRLARTHRTIPDDNRDLRQHVALLIFAGNTVRHALQAPFTHDDDRDLEFTLSPDRRTLLTYSKGYRTCRLWDVVTRRLIRELRKDREDVVACGMDPTGKTIYTSSLDGVIRFWDVPSGKLRAETVAQPERYKDYDPTHKWKFSGAFQLTADRLLTWRENVRPPKKGKDRITTTFSTQDGPVELWDTRSGKRIAVLPSETKPVPNTQQYKDGKLVAESYRDDANKYRLSPDGKWVTTIVDQEGVVVYSAIDGKQVAVVKSDTGMSGERLFSPSESRLVMSFRREVRVAQEYPQLEIWDTSNWSKTTVEVQTEDLIDPAWITDDVLKIEEHDEYSAYPNRTYHYRLTKTGRLEKLDDQEVERLTAPRVGQWLNVEGKLFDLDSGRWVPPPAGRRYHPNLAKFSPDGRVAPLGHGRREWIDLVVELPIQFNDGAMTIASCVPGYGFVESKGNLVLRTDRLEFDPELLELWVQVVTCSELNEDGEIRQLTEAEWEQRRQRLGRYSPPYPDFPFPGHIASDRLYWLRLQHSEVDRREVQIQAVKRILHRAEEYADKVEIHYWRQRLDQLEPENKP